MVSVKIASKSELPHIEILYARCGYRGGLDSHDTVFIASDSSRVVGAVRLCPEFGTWVLRGMHVDPQYQRQGIGSVLLRECMQWLDSQVCYCIPYRHLCGFYAAAGFRAIPLQVAPVFLKSRFRNYLRKGLDVIIMQRNPNQG